MAEQQFSDLEQFLMPYAIGRFQDKNLKDLKNRLDIMIKKDFLDYLTWMVRVFVRCISTANESLYLKDITTIVLAEANFISNAPPFSIFVSNNMLNSFQTFDFFLLMESEIHRWLVILQDNSKLNGVYWRFTGKFVKA